MMSGKQIISIVKGLGIFLLLLGMIFLAFSVYRFMVPVRTAVIQEVGEPYYIHGPGDDIRNEYGEKVTALTEDGETVTVKIVRGDEKDLPGAGDEIRVYGHYEYTGLYAKVILWVGYGLLCIAAGIRIFKILGEEEGGRHEEE